MLAALTKAADAGQVCPSNVDLRIMVGCNVTGLIDTIHKLERRGLISVKRGRTWRVVTVIATGKSTAPVTHKQVHARAQTVAKARRDELAERVAEGSTLVAAAQAMGMTDKRASQIWRRIKDDLGWQAHG